MFQHNEFFLVGPIEQFDTNKKLSFVCKVGLTIRLPPLQKDLSNGIIDFVTICIAHFFNDFSTIALLFSLIRERRGTVVECLTHNRGAVGVSITGVTVLWSLSKTRLS